MFKLLIGGARSNTRILDRNDNLIWMEITFCGMLGHGIFLTYSNNVWRIRECFESTNNSIVSRMHAEWTVITNYTGTFFFSLRQQLLLNFRNLRNSAFDKPIIMQMANRIRNICSKLYCVAYFPTNDIRQQNHRMPYRNGVEL